ncbi:MAG: DUF2304 domain-containing protein [Oscillospiraceae bacterium]
MMSAAVRIVLVLGAICTTAFMLRKIRRSKIQIDYSIFWILFSACVIVLSLFPQIAFWAAKILGMQSPINVVYLIMIFILFIKLFSMTAKVSQLESKISVLAQKTAIEQNKKESQD